ncbi:biotin/lipoyl-containing protein, partial [uncultured Akkermansia sp.]|uniref:biotin/lipoyl-containing protein n=1 Tax=uncultured Akkermansia sp. TaxID=512294 RepID=UPI0025ED893E
MAITIEMPRLSDSMHEGIVLRWVKKIGDFVEVGDHLADIETDKAHVELQACEDGTLTEILVPEGGSAAVGAPIALLQSEFGASTCDCPPCPPVKCSPLAARLALEAGLNPGTLKGTGPHGKIMAADVRAAIRPAEGPARRVHIPLAPRDTRHATRVDNFYLYSLEANMAYLAAISTPIAVQCEKLIGGRYNLLDYVVRAAGEAGISRPEWLAGDAAAEQLMGLDKGEKYVFIENASGKTIYNIAMERMAAPAAGPPPASRLTPHLLLSTRGLNRGTPPPRLP